MPSVRLANVLLFCVALGIATTAAAQSQPNKLEVLGRQGDYYWVVETAQDGSRKGGWVAAQIIDVINRNALQAIPPLGAVQAAPPVVAIPDASIDSAVTRTSSETRSAPVRRASAAQPIRQGSGAQHPQVREGFWFNGGLGFGYVGCEGCIGREGGGSGGLSLGGTISDRLLLGVGTTGWYKSVDGIALSVGTLDARLRFYPSVTSGFFLTGGLGLGTISVDVARFGNGSETGVGLMLGLGWDIRVRPNLSLTPFWNGTSVRTSNADANFGQLGLGITIH